MIAHHKLKDGLRAFRIGQPKGKYEIWSSLGAYENAGRWNEKGSHVIYTANCFSLALLEVLVRLTIFPDEQYYVEVTIPKGTSYHEINGDTVDGWYTRNHENSRKYANNWYKSGKSCVLIVPSVVVRQDKNIIINTQHADFDNINVSNEMPVIWDSRIFEKLSI